MKNHKSHYDVAVLGGGLAGLTFAVQCKQQVPKAKIVVLEKREHPVPEAAHKVGESTVEVAAHYFGEILGLKQHIKEEQLPKLGLRFFFPAGDNSRIEDRLELGGKRYAPCPSYQLDRGRFENHLGDLCLELGVDFLDQAKISNINIKNFGRHEVAYHHDGESKSVKARWVIDASGRRAFLKRQLGLQHASEHVANAAWFRFEGRIKIDDWSDDQAWAEGHHDKTARWYSTNHLMGQGYWVWLIPLSSGSTSIGIVAAEEFHSLSEFNSIDKAISWLEKHEPQCADAIKQHRDSLQDFRAIKNYSTECKQVFSAQRWGITGEAGFFHDPFYSPGSDFIAFSNTFLTDLVSRDLSWRPFRSRTYAYDKIFKRFYYGTLTAYENQYQMFGNPVVMPTKILWDYLIYWSITGFIFFHERMCQQTMYLRNLRRLNRLGELNHSMQEFFRHWHVATESETANGTVDISQLKIIREMNQQLKDKLKGGQFFERFDLNLKQLETLATEIIANSELSFKPTGRNWYGQESGVRENAFQGIFESTVVTSDVSSNSSKSPSLCKSL